MICHNKYLHLGGVILVSFVVGVLASAVVSASLGYVGSSEIGNVNKI